MVKFSVIIPTRQRHETLPYAIKTVLNQSFDDYELIICDNNSSAETRDVVDEINSPKIKYIRSDSPLAMHENWELAVSKAEGEYVILFGDDDGLMPHTLKLLNNLIEQSSLQVIAWDRISYHWPNLVPEYFANRIHIPIGGRSFLVDGKWIVKEVAESKRSYSFLPMLYNSVIKKSLLDTLRIKTGRVFQSIVPDIYSGFAIAHLCGSYLYLETPLSINGASIKSNGHSYFFGTNKGVTNDFNVLNQGSPVVYHKKVPYIKSIPAAVAESYYQLSDHLLNGSSELNRESLFRKIVGWMNASSFEEWNENIVKIKESLASEGRLVNKLEAEGLFKQPKHLNKENAKSLKKGIVGGVLNVDATEFGVRDVNEAAIFCEKILSLEQRDVRLLMSFQKLKPTAYVIFRKGISKVARVLVRLKRKLLA